MIQSDRKLEFQIGDRVITNGCVSRPPRGLRGTVVGGVSTEAEMYYEVAFDCWFGGHDGKGNHGGEVENHWYCQGYMINKIKED